MAGRTQQMLQNILDIIVAGDVEPDLIVIIGHDMNYAINGLMPRFMKMCIDTGLDPAQMTHRHVDSVKIGEWVIRFTSDQGSREVTMGHFTDHIFTDHHVYEDRVTQGNIRYQQEEIDRAKRKDLNYQAAINWPGGPPPGNPADFKKRPPGRRAGGDPE